MTPWGFAPLGAQMGLRTLIHRGGVTDTVDLGRVEHVRVDGAGNVWMRTRATGRAAEEPPVVWSTDRRGELRRREVHDYPEAPPSWWPEPRARRAAESSSPDATAAVRPFPDTLALVRGSSEAVGVAEPFLDSPASGRVAPETRFWVRLTPDRFAWIDGPAGRVVYYGRRGERAVRIDAVTVPEGRRSSERGTRLGLDRAVEEGGRRDRVVGALADDTGRLWLLLGWSDEREEWAVMDATRATVVEIMVFPDRFQLQAVRGDRLVGVQRGDRRDALHVLVRGES